MNRITMEDAKDLFFLMNETYEEALRENKEEAQGLEEDIIALKIAIANAIIFDQDYVSVEFKTVENTVEGIRVRIIGEEDVFCQLGGDHLFEIGDRVIIDFEDETPTKAGYITEFVNVPFGIDTPTAYFYDPDTRKRAEEAFERLLNHVHDDKQKEDAINSLAILAILTK